MSKDQRGITGLETAIVLIAFVVVSSVFAFAALSTGLFSADKSKETIQAGLSEARGTLEIKGGVKATATITAVANEAVGTGNGTATSFTLAHNPVIPGSQTVKVAAVTKTYGTDYSMNFETGVITFTAAPANAAAVTASYSYYLVTAVKITVANAAGGRAIDMSGGATVLTYLDPDTVATNITNYTLTWLGTSNGNNLLETGEMVEISVNTSSYGLLENGNFAVQIKPPSGAVLNIGRTIPATMAAVMNLG